jgi:hypothetical protein|tara:strand:+ start:554 stop:727 length:174 start_codon:yes stop_codon:yes gene_type:complete
MSKFKFDKFIKDIAKRETAAKRMTETQQENVEETPQRKYNKLYRERWQNSIRYGRKK